MHDACVGSAVGADEEEGGGGEGVEDEVGEDAAVVNAALKGEDAGWGES